MAHRALILALLASCLGASPVLAQDQDDEIVRLPGQGFTKPEARKGRNLPDRLVPGGGLFVSFDLDADGQITPAERAIGIAAAFEQADTNADGELTAFEQISWAGGLPTHDDTLANPVRFDPNLDRSVSRDEFADVIGELATHYADASSGIIAIAALKAPDRKEGRTLSDFIRPEDFSGRGPGY